MKTPNIIISIISIIFGVLVYVFTLDFPQLTGSDSGPAFMPRIYAIFIMIFGISLLVKSIFFSNEEANPISKKVLIYILMFIIYICLIPLIGVYGSTVLFLVFMLWFSQVRRLVVLIAVPAGAVLFIFLFFQQLLNVPIPGGLLY